MTARHRKEPVRTGSAVRRAVVTSVLAAVALTSVTITAAAVTLTNATPRPDPPAAAPESASTAPIDDPTLAPPVEVEELPIGIPDIALVAADGPQLSEVPDAALAAYQRAAGVLGGADKQCHLGWTLVAAVGQVVTGHGTAGDSALDRKGVMRPKYAGKALRGRDGRRVPDSDAGRLDGDGRFDRPVGPLQLSPATWAVVGVDSDGDGKRNPHDIDDAALAVSVLLCSGAEDLRRRPGRVDAVRRINDDRSFIETVLAVDRAYRVQMSDPYGSYDVDTVQVPYDPPILPTDLPIDARTGVPTDLPTAPSPDPSPTATDPVTWVPTPPSPTPTKPRDPDRPWPPCAPDTTDPTDPDPTGPVGEPSETTTAEPTDPPTAEPTADPTADPTDDSTDDQAGGKPGCVPAPDDPEDPDGSGERDADPAN